MKQGFIKVAAAAPKLRVADCDFNANEMIALAKKADSLGAKLIVFPELSITASTCKDLFLSDCLLSGAIKALKKFANETRSLEAITVVGLPVKHRDSIYNCAAVCKGGEVLRFIPKATLSSEEKRYFSEPTAEIGCVYFDDDFVSIGTNYVFSCDRLQGFRFAVAIGEDAFSCSSALNNALIIANPTATPEAFESADERRLMIKAISKKSATGIIHANAGYGESSTDLAFASHQIIVENGEILAESSPFEIAINASEDERLTVSEIDVSLLSQERCKRGISGASEEAFEVAFDMFPCETSLTRKYKALPFVPEGEPEKAKTIIEIQARALCKRIEAAYASKLVIGISGGLDSTLALLVAARAIDLLGRPRTDIIGITMPCFGTTERTKGNAEILCEELGISFKTVCIADSVLAHFKDIGHDPENHNVVFENSQARERTQVLMDIANAENGMVIGTGDMSELALGWATYNGDHMSMYGVNASVTKTLVRYLVEYCAEEADKLGKSSLRAVLRDILDTPVSPELLPADGDTIKQKTEDIVGPYEIHDFYLYYMLKYGFSPKKLYRLACYALGDTFSSEVLLKWLEVFTKRFFSQQYKRSCLPDGPRVSELSLSPRGDLMMPSDAVSALWLSEINELKSAL